MNKIQQTIRSLLVVLAILNFLHAAGLCFKQAGLLVAAGWLMLGLLKRFADRDEEEDNGWL